MKIRMCPQNGNEGQSHQAQLCICRLWMSRSRLLITAVRKGVAIACLGGALKSKWSDLVLHRPVLESLLRTDSSRLIGHDRGEDIDRGGCVPILGRCLLHLLKVI